MLRDVNPPFFPKTKETNTMDKKNEAVELKALRLIADGARTPAALKAKMRKDVRRVMLLLRKDNSIKTKGDQMILTRKGAGRLRFAS